MDYGLLKLIHITGVVMFLGNITTGLFWAAYAHRQQNFMSISLTFQGIIGSDRWFTMPGVILILIGGFGAAIYGSIPILRTGWIFWSIVLFSISGIIFSIRLAPLQKTLQRYTGTTSQSDESWKEYRGLYKRWEAWGLIALLAPVLAMVIMVLKLPLPGL